MTRGGALDHPVGLGREVSGTVEALGDGVTGFAPGDEVLAQVADGPRGGFATYALVAASWTAPKPAGVSFTDAAALPIAAATAYDGINQLDLHSGATLLVIGAGGGVGIAACQFAHNRGARVIGVASAAKRELVEAVGAVHVPSGDNAMTDARSLAPNGVDGLFDLVGGTALLGLGTLVDDGSRIVTAADEATAVALGGALVQRADSQRARGHRRYGRRRDFLALCNGSLPSGQGAPCPWAGRSRARQGQACAPGSLTTG